MFWDDPDYLRHQAEKERIAMFGPPKGSENYKVYVGGILKYDGPDESRANAVFNAAPDGGSKSKVMMQGKVCRAAYHPPKK